MTTTSMPMRADERAKGPSLVALRILVGLTVALAVVGVAVVGHVLTSGAPTVTGRSESVMGQAVQTSFGAFTVTNVATTFVPDTQGPPTTAQHNGSNGKNQLQVWVRLVNARAEHGLAYAPSQLRLVTGARSGKGQGPDGSSIKPALLPRGTSIDGQVWFDLPKESQSVGAGWWLEFHDPGGDVVRVALDPQRAGAGPASPSPPAGEGAHSRH